MLLQNRWFGYCLVPGRTARKEVIVMYAKFPFYSVAQMYAITLETPVAILLGNDNLYWVVDQWKARDYLDEGCSMLSAAN